MARASLPWVLTAALAAGVPKALADTSADSDAVTDFVEVEVPNDDTATPTDVERGAIRRGFLDGTLDHDNISEHRIGVLWAWVRSKTLRLRRRAEMRHARATNRGEEPEPLPERVPLDEMTDEEVAAELRELSGIELVAAKADARDAEDAVKEAEANPEASEEEVDLKKAEAEAAEVAVEVAEEEVEIAEEVEEVADEVVVDEEEEMVADEVVVEEEEEMVADEEQLIADEEELIADEEEMTGEEAVSADCGGAPACAILPVQKILDENYDPRDIDWAGLHETVMQIAAREPRVCSFAMRAAFHDAGSWTGEDTPTGADASLVIDDAETFLGDSTVANFAPYARAVLSHMSDFYKCSAGDLLGVVSSICPKAIAGDDFAGNDPVFDVQDEATGLHVGKIDNTDEVEAAMVQEMHRQIPNEFDGMPKFIDFWRRHMNGALLHPTNGNGGRFTEREVVALMGAHTLMDNQGCSEETCGGAKKSLTWNVDWYKDMNSGSCTPRTPPPLDDDVVPTSLNGGKGRIPNAEQREEMRQCGFKSTAGLELMDDIQCQVDEKRGGPEDIGRMSGYDFMFVDWEPEADTRSECCGELCEPCSGTDSTWFCEGSEAGTSHWAYTWADCEMKYAFDALSNGGYCGTSHAHGVDCSGFETSPEEIEDFLVNLKTGFPCDGPCEFEQRTMHVFEEQPRKWEHYVNKGMGRLMRQGATWSNPVLLKDLIGCDDDTVCPGEAMPVPSGVCPAIAAIFGG